jgi:tetratricopeptide (TPR) repeat protein
MEQAKLRLAAGALSATLLAGLAGPALADFSACDSAFRESDPNRKLVLWTHCITKSGLTGAERAGGFNNRGLVYEKLGEPDKAVQDFTWSIQSDPNWGTAYVNRGQMYLSCGDWAKAEADCSKATKLPPAEDRAAARKCVADARERLQSQGDAAAPSDGAPKP